MFDYNLKILALWSQKCASNQLVKQLPLFILEFYDLHNCWQVILCLGETNLILDLMTSLNKKSA